MCEALAQSGERCTYPAMWEHDGARLCFHHHKLKTVPGFTLGVPPDVPKDLTALKRRQDADDTPEQRLQQIRAYETLPFVDEWFSAVPPSDPDAARNRERIAWALLRLTERQREIAGQLASGENQVGIARALGVSRAAVSDVVAAIRRRLSHLEPEGLPLSITWPPSPSTFSFTNDKPEREIPQYSPGPVKVRALSDGRFLRWEQPFTAAEISSLSQESWRRVPWKEQDRHMEAWARVGFTGFGNPNWRAADDDDDDEDAWMAWSSREEKGGKSLFDTLAPPRPVGDGWLTPVIKRIHGTDPATVWLMWPEPIPVADWPHVHRCRPYFFPAGSITLTPNA
jgi:DNA-binding CsgD family transcriptional regulator